MNALTLEALRCFSRRGSENASFLDRRYLFVAWSGPWYCVLMGLERVAKCIRPCICIYDLTFIACRDHEAHAEHAPEIIDVRGHVTLKKLKW